MHPSTTTDHFMLFMPGFNSGSTHNGFVYQFETTMRAGRAAETDSHASLMLIVHPIASSPCGRIQNWGIEVFLCCSGRKT